MAAIVYSLKLKEPLAHCTARELCFFLLLEFPLRLPSKGRLRCFPYRLPYGRTNPKIYS